VYYLRDVGLSVPTEQLSLAFYQTYGLSADFSESKVKRANVGGYRFAVRHFIPRIAYAVTVLHRKHEAGRSNGRGSAEITIGNYSSSREKQLGCLPQNAWDRNV
jgi:hypothetical protein